MLDPLPTNASDLPIAQPAPGSAAPLKPNAPSPGYWREVWRRFRRRKLAMIALVYVIFLGIVGVATPFIVGTKPIVVYYKGSYYFPAMAYFQKSWENPIFQKDRIKLRSYAPKFITQKDPESWLIWPYLYQDPEVRVQKNNPFERPENPSGGEPSELNLMGTTPKGIDVFTAMLYGTSNALLIGFVSTGIAALIGITLGAAAGFFGGWVDLVLSRILEIVLCIPTLVLILAVISLVERSTLWHVMAVIGLTTWPSIARLTRAEFMKLKQLEYVAAARALGAGNMRIMFRHILPNALAPVLVPITFGIASAILTESALSYLGIGTAGTMARWGTLLNTAREDWNQWWLVVFPGGAIFSAVLAYNLIGEGLQEATDPRLRNR